MNWLWFLVGTLAAYRFAHAFSFENGPGNLFFAAREWVINRFGYASWQSEFTRCPLCQGFWAALVMTLLLFAGILPLGQILVAWWGMAGGLVVLHLLLYSARG